jgi:hypothetical protein
MIKTPADLVSAGVFVYWGGGLNLFGETSSVNVTAH